MRKYTVVAAKEFGNDRVGADRMDEMFEAIWPEFDLCTKDPPTPEVEECFRLLKASKESLHEHTKVTLLAFVTWWFLEHISLGAMDRSVWFYT
jgi:hypothetical protein